MSARTWFITSTTYGTWLPGDKRGFVSNTLDSSGEWSRSNIPDTPYDTDNPPRRAQAEAMLHGSPIFLSVHQAETIAAQFHETANHRHWRLHVFAVMANHFHIVLSADTSVESEDILRDLKAYASRRLNKRWSTPASETWWTESGSRRPVPDEDAFTNVVRYVAQQPQKLAFWILDELRPLIANLTRGNDVIIERPSRGLTPPAQQEWRALDAAHVWHPFTPMSAYVEEHAPIIADADGFFLIDVDGNRYLDGHSSLWCNIHGHRVPQIDAAISSQLDRVAHSTLLGLSNVPSIELAAELVKRAPTGLNKVFYADCGAAGVEVALKIAWQYHRQKPQPQERDLFVCLGSAYHGDTVGTISLGGIDRFHSLFGGLMFPSLRVPTPATPGLSLEDCLAQTEALLTPHAERIAGFVIEPLVQAAAGILVHPPGYLRAIRELTQRLGILLIADEIAVAFGRLGTLFACEQEGVSPDMLILSKGLTGGYLPLAATLVTDDVYNAFLGEPWAGRTFYHGHTYTGNPLACAAALASLRLIEANGVLENARQIEQTITNQLKPRDGHPWVSSIHVRHRGTMVGIELLRDDGTPFPPERRIGHQVTLACRQRGVIVRNIGNTIVLMPAPAMPVGMVQTLCEVVNAAIAEVAA